jgi:two-component system phosphate regulon sensor histidine kinase PhoR
LLVSATGIVAIIIAIQLYWLQKIYNFEQKQFNINVSKSIRAVYEKFNNEPTTLFEQAIENPTPDIYLARMDSMPNFTLMTQTISRELTDFDIFTDCKLGIYFRHDSNYRYQTYIDKPDANFRARPNIELPVFKREYNYLVLNFPNRTRYVLKQMSFWILSGALLVLVLLGFALSILYLYRQKFLNETQKDFVNNFTHEFKTPLSVMRIAADVLQEDNILERPAKLKKYVHIMREQTMHLQQQTDRLLQIAFTEQKAISLHRSYLNPLFIVLQAMENLTPMIEQRKARIDIEDHAEGKFLYADSSYLQLVILNLIENALKYSANPLLRIHASLEDKMYVLAFIDNGVGIEKRFQKKIFDRFYRVSLGNVQQVNGFGLGLSFVKTIIQAHGGHISVESNPGKGSTFIIKIPLHTHG